LGPGKAYVAVRPYRVSIGPLCCGNGELEGHVSKVAYVRDHLECGVRISIPAVELIAIVPEPMQAFAKGAKVAVKINPSSAVLVPADQV